MIIRDFYHTHSLTRSYIVAHARTGCAVIIDPVLEQVADYSDAIERLRLRLVATIETHLHDDHVTGAYQLRARYGSRVLYPAGLGAMGIDGELRDGDQIQLGKTELKIMSTPGQTAHAISVLANTDQTNAVFTGDLTHAAGVPMPDDRSLLATLFRTIRERIFTLPGRTTILPGHDLKDARFTTVAAERAFNPFVGGNRTLDRFIEVMEEASTRPHFTLDNAARRNLLGGLMSSCNPATGRSRALHRLERFVGPRPVSLAWLQRNRETVHVIDFRHQSLFDAAHIYGALHGGDDLGEVMQGWSRERDIVCVAGTEADRVCLERLGFDRLCRIDADPSLWRAEGLPVTSSNSKSLNLAVA